VLTLVDVPQFAGAHEYQFEFASGNPLRDIELIVIALLPVFCIAKAVTELPFALLTHMCVFETLIDSDCVLVWNMLPPKKITPAPSTTDAIRIIKVVITFPIPLRFLTWKFMSDSLSMRLR